MHPRRISRDKEPSRKVHLRLKAMDTWVNGSYLATAVLLALVGGGKLLMLVIFIYPCISLVYFVVRYRYLKSLSTEQARSIFPYSHEYIGAGVSAFILSLALISCAMGLYNCIIK
ncbi:hypothetical protein IFR09_01260 [Pseudomonas syringae]|nr:hypothetical protein [Pseudomonas syringae]MBD8809788.1 hypothetical protein [Pseudomonas syringae]